MHEMSIAEGIIEIVERTAKANGVTRVKEVRIEVGELAGVDIPSLEFAWVSVTRGGPAEGSGLVIERPGARPGASTAPKPSRLPNMAIPAPSAGAFISLPREALKCASSTSSPKIDFYGLMRKQRLSTPLKRHRPSSWRNRKRKGRHEEALLYCNAIRFGLSYLHRLEEDTI